MQINLPGNVKLGIHSLNGDNGRTVGFEFYRDEYCWTAAFVFWFGEIYLMNDYTANLLKARK